MKGEVSIYVATTWSTFVYQEVLTDLHKFLFFAVKCFSYVLFVVWASVWIKSDNRFFWKRENASIKFEIFHEKVGEGLKTIANT